MASNAANLVKEGIAAFKAGRKAEAQQLLSRATELDPHNEEAWLWLSAMVESLENQQICLENVLAINPHNTRALKGLEMIQRQLAKKNQQQAQQTSYNAPPFPSDPFNFSTPSKTPPPEAAPPPPPVPPESSVPAKPAEDEAGYHGSGRQVALPSEDEYDAWLQGLNLGGEEEVDLPPAAAAPMTDPFEFESGPFQPSDPGVDEASFMADLDLPGEDNAAPFTDMVSPEPEVDEFEATAAAFDPFALPSQQPTYDDYDDDVDMGTGADDPFDGLDMAEGEFASATPFATAEMDAGYDYDYETEDDLIENLTFIPDEIKATHLPGQQPRFPRGLALAVGVLSLGVVASVGTMIFLIMTRLG